MWSGFPCVDCRDISLKFFQFCFNCLTPHCTLSHCFLFACISTFLGEEIYSDPSFTSLSLSSARPRNFDPTSDIARTVRNSKPAIYDILNSYAAPRTLQDAGRSSVLGGVLPRQHGHRCCPPPCPTSPEPREHRKHLSRRHRHCIATTGRCLLRTVSGLHPTNPRYC
jgi:hypothetical protein